MAALIEKKIKKKKKSRTLIWIKQLFNTAYYQILAPQADRKKYFEEKTFSQQQVENWAKNNKQEVKKAMQLLVKQAKFAKLNAWNQSSIANRMAYFAAGGVKKGFQYYIKPQGKVIQFLTKAETVMKNAQTAFDALKKGKQIYDTFTSATSLMTRGYNVLSSTFNFVKQLIYGTQAQIDARQKQEINDKQYEIRSIQKKLQEMNYNPSNEVGPMNMEDTAKQIQIQNLEAKKASLGPKRNLRL